MTPINRKMARALGIACLGFASSFALAGSAQKAPAAAAPVRPLTLPISFLDVMRASIEIPADGIWAAEGADKLAEEDWQLADQDAVNLIAATTLLASAGTGKNDAAWVAKADWQTWVRDMEKTALQIRSAVKAMDQKKMAAAADHLQEICEACHTKYRPQAPSDGVSRYPFYPKRELAK
jgi:Cytochrome C'